MTRDNPNPQAKGTHLFHAAYSFACVASSVFHTHIYVYKQIGMSETITNTFNNNSLLWIIMCSVGVLYTFGLLLIMLLFNV